MRFPTGNTQLQQVEGGAMKSRTTKNTYPSISASYWQPAPTPSPYLIPGTIMDFLFFFSLLINMRKSRTIVFAKRVASFRQRSRASFVGVVVVELQQFGQLCKWGF